MPLGVEKDVILGRTVKLVALDPVPPALVTLTTPVVAPAGTVALICVGETTVYVTAATPLNATLVTPTKVVPVKVTVEPMIPLGTDKLVTVGGTPKFDALDPLPAGFVTVIVPVEAPAGTVAVICV